MVTGSENEGSHFLLLPATLTLLNKQELLLYILGLLVDQTVCNSPTAVEFILATRTVVDTVTTAPRLYTHLVCSTVERVVASTCLYNIRSPS